MNWPENLEDVDCVGFSDGSLCELSIAVDNHEVMWVTQIRSRKTSDGRYSEFDYLGFRYAVDELYEITGIEPGADGMPREKHDYVPVRVERIAKVNVDDDGKAFVVEQYPLAMHPTVKPPKYVGQWASF